MHTKIVTGGNDDGKLFIRRTMKDKNISLLSGLLHSNPDKRELICELAVKMASEEMTYSYLTHLGWL
jgi:hypothetical protein